MTLPAGYTLPGEPSDVFRIFAVPLPVERHPLRARASSSVPATRASCITPTSASTARDGSRRLDAADPAPGYDGLMARSAEYPDGHFLGWTPGQIAPLVDADLAWRLDPGTDLVVQLHMQPSGKPEAVRADASASTSATGPPTRTPSILRLGSQGIDIAPGDAPLRRGGSLHAAGGRDAAGRAAARALPRRRRHAARRPSPTARRARSSTSAPGTSAGSTSIATPSRSRCRKGTTRGDALRLRQLAGESAQPAGAAGARCAGGSDRSTRWATCGSSSPPRPTPTGRGCARRCRPR